MTKTWHIHITGLVQGIGFRPYVYNLAMDHSLNGWVKNDRDGLHIHINGTEETVEDFYQKLLSGAPELASIKSSKIEELPFNDYQNFKIIHDSTAENASVNLTPDFATCQSCLAELKDTQNRRYKYPFITCSECGPRYSIIYELPYDRQQTKMDAFSMCELCESEYNSPLDRRYYAQTNSCSSCGVQLSLYNSKKEILEKDNNSIIKYISEKWRDGKIFAIKGIGGYLITCSSGNEQAIATLRSRKRRPDKPLAIMVPGLHSINCTELECDELSSATSPIVLVSKPDNIDFTTGICDGLSRVGIMIPYTPLFKLLLDDFQGPIVTTSGNISNAPIIFQDDHGLEDLFEVADYILVNNRGIVIPQDDSVIVFSRHFNKRIILRRSRGMAPSYINSKLKLDSTSVLAMGANLKSTFSILHKDNIYVSQYLGDLDNYETQQHYDHTLKHFVELLEIQPKRIIVDLHNQYSSTIRGNDLSSKLNIPIIKVQHHLAHFAALIGEHVLMDSTEKILGVIWDGTGLGDDGQIWGGEFFNYNNYQFNRVDHLPYFPHLANDKMAKEPRLSALSLCYDIKDAQKILQPKFSEEEWRIYSRQLKGKKLIQTSSIGRLFDAVAALLNISDIQTYEGQAASLLQVQAEKHFEQNGIEYGDSYFHFMSEQESFTKNLASGIISDLENATSVSCIAAKFHLTLVHWIGHRADLEKVAKIGFSGGVFQNTLLVDLIWYHLKDRYELLFHKDLSSNDENISFGQLIFASIQAKSS